MYNTVLFTGKVLGVHLKQNARDSNEVSYLDMSVKTLNVLLLAEFKN